jgi:signal transduction histidine kinase
MVFMSILNVILSESAMWENQQVTFLNDIHMMVTNIENQLVISNEWIARMERGGQYIIAISDNGNPILYDELVYTKERQMLVNAAREQAIEEHGFLPITVTSVTRVTNFMLNTAMSNQYFASVALIPSNGGTLEVIFVHSLEPLRRQIFNQRITVMIFNLIGVGLLGVFSYFFTRRMIKPLEKSRKQQTEFIASASHELRTPLAVIQTTLSAFLKADEEQAIQFYNSMESECKRMSRLVDDLLALANADSYTLLAQMKDVEIDTLLLNVAEKFDLIGQEKEITISVKLPSKKSPTIKGDVFRLTQVLAILLDNAISYSPKGSKVILTMEVLKHRVSICVIDNGIGIPDEEKEKIWERFYRVDSSRKSGEHFGLGLPIAKEIINLHKGKIIVKDNPEGGSIFIVSL